MLKTCLRVALLFGLFSTFHHVAAQSSPLQIDENHIRLQLLPDPQIELPLVNSAGQPIECAFLMELIDIKGAAVSSREGTFIAVPGSSTEKVVWAPARLPFDSPSELGWLRLRYTITSKGGLGFAPVRGIVQLGPLMRDAFELRMTASRFALPGTKYPVRVRVDNPSTAKPRSGVPVKFELSIDDEAHPVLRTAVTDKSGYATTIFDLPGDSSPIKGEITATATRESFQESESIEFQFFSLSSMTVTTDKPLYQPGQTLHMRLLAFGFDKQAWAGANINLSIQDSEGQEVYRTTVTSSKFGVATTDWEIPAKLPLDRYSIRAEVTGPNEQYNVSAGADVRVSRYELPEFTVKAAPDRSFYLPGQDAQIQVSADYLFGKPVQHAKVRIVQQEERRWNAMDQKWDVEESPAVEGELDVSGGFTGRVSLKESFADFEESEDRRYQDLTLAAYVTDLSSGRTEQRRVKLRLTRQPIHLYLTSRYRLSADQPLVLYVTSSNADGTPASVTGTIDAARPNNAGEFDEHPDSSHRVTIARFRTNKYGVARVELSPLPEDFATADPTGRHRLLLSASDARGQKGELSDDLDLSLGRDFMTLRTDHALYHPGDEIIARINSNAHAREVVVDIRSQGQLLASRVVHLSQGRVDFSLPYDERFRGEINITAHAIAAVGDSDSALAATTSVIYPFPQDLRVEVRMPKTTFRPGDSASVKVHVDSPDGKDAQSALGVLVFDRAVAERVRSDEEFKRDYGFSILDYYRDNGGIGGITHRDLLNFDPAKPFPPDLDLAAEFVLQSTSYSGDVALSGGTADYASQASYHFRVAENPRIKQLESIMERHYSSTREYPRTAAEFRSILKDADMDLDLLRDPWDIPYRVVFSLSGSDDELSLVSNGMDKQANNADDFTVKTFRWRYFNKVGRAIDDALIRHLKQTGQYIRDYPALRQELAKDQIDLDSIRDPWGTPYRYSFSISGPHFIITVDSAGPDKRFDSKLLRSHDDVLEWTGAIHYFQQETADLNQALAESFAISGKFPENEDELQPVVHAAKLTPERLLDPWGNPYHYSFVTRSRYADEIVVRTYSQAAGQPQKSTEVTPVTQQLAYIVVSSYGPDNKPARSFAVAEFSRLIVEMTSKDIHAMHTPGQPPARGGTGMISGVVTDASGAVVQRVSITATSDDTGQEFTTITDSNGAYLFRDLPSGIFRLKFIAQGFRPSVVLQVPVQNAGTTRVNNGLVVNGAIQAIEVSASPILLETSSVEVISRAAPQRGTPAEDMNKQPFTPRLRQYFPETLVWHPEIVSDFKGNASFSFAMADNITSWKMSIMASTLQGKVGTAEKEFRTFQPFFIVHNPPRVLTEGDRISLPVVIRNYSGKTQTVQAELQPQPWFSILSAPRQNVTIALNSDANTVFSFRAVASTRSGTQRVSARNTETGDAVERQVAVHPDGQQVSLQLANLLGPSDDSLDFVVPPEAIRGSAEAELRIYPNLIAHMVDALHGMAQRPSGCNEQITSIGYANLLLLQALRKTGQYHPETGSGQSTMVADSIKHLQDAYQLLSHAEKSDGSISYWSGSEADVALTAYVLRFLTAAGEFVRVDDDAIVKARDYLLAQQSKSGAWRAYNWRQQSRVDNPNLSAYVARALASARMHGNDKQREQAEESIARAMNYMEAQIDSWKDAYLVGNYAIVAATSEEERRITRANSALASLAHQEGPTTYWNLEANTSPFYGWGSGGRIETTALAVEAFTLLHTNAQDINRGLQYLLGHKDRYAMWYSTQATQNVFEAILATLPPHLEPGVASEATVTNNGNKISTIKLPPSQTVTGPTILELDQYLSGGRNHLQILRPSSASAMNVVLAASYYVPPRNSTATAEENVTRGDTRALRLKVHFDRTDLDLKDIVTCRVEAERIGFMGYGMMVAEVGLPPAADVDRASLEKARVAGSIDGYEVQPDKLVFYLWPSAGGTGFTFQFHSRMRMEAMSGPSLLYDYYNPEASASVSPVRFFVH